MWLYKIKEGFLYYRFFWHLTESGSPMISLEFTPRRPFSYGFSIDGTEAQVQFSFWLIFQVYLTFEGFLPKSWYPTYQSKSHGELPAEREISLRFHHWGLWWTVWTDPDSWSSADPRWQQGNLDFWKILFGDFDISRERQSPTVEVLPFFEGIYFVTVCRIEKEIRYRRSYSRVLARWWWDLTGKQFYYYEIRGGRETDGEFEDIPIPVPGKGTASYNIGEDAIYVAGFNVGSAEKALFRMWEDVMSQRRRYGNALWTPQEQDGAITDLGLITN